MQFHCSAGQCTEVTEDHPSLMSACHTPVPCKALLCAHTEPSCAFPSYRHCKLGSKLLSEVWNQCCFTSSLLLNFQLLKNPTFSPDRCKMLKRNKNHTKGQNSTKKWTESHRLRCPWSLSTTYNTERISTAVHVAKAFTGHSPTFADLALYEQDVHSGTFHPQRVLD